MEITSGGDIDVFQDNELRSNTLQKQKDTSISNELQLFRSVDNSFTQLKSDENNFSQNFGELDYRQIKNQ